VARRKVLRPGEEITIRFTLQERDLILDHTLAGPDLTDRLRLAIMERGQITAKYSLEDLDELLGYIAAEANHSEDERRATRLYKLYDRLSDIEASVVED
jgi:hypothetical protein